MESITAYISGEGWKQMVYADEARTEFRKGFRKGKEWAKEEAKQEAQYMVDDAIQLADDSRESYMKEIEKLETEIDELKDSVYNLMILLNEGADMRGKFTLQIAQMEKDKD